MRNGVAVACIIPALNEEEAIGKVVSEIPPWVDDIVVVDNGSTDRTAEMARRHGARTVCELHRGYGAACLTGIATIGEPGIVVFLDGDYSDRPQEMDRLVDPIIKDRADLVIGSRVLGDSERGALTPQAQFGNRLACALIRSIWKVRYTDLGPFRAVRFSALEALGMSDPGYGWTVEMQIKAARSRIRILEVPVSYHRRIGKSKISGTVTGVLGAGTKILATIFLSLLRSPPRVDLRTESLIVFTRYPEPGKTKSRLIPVLGEEGAADLQRRMTIHAVLEARRLRETRPVSIEVHYEGANAAAMKAWLGPDLNYRLQARGDLGERMAGAFRHAFYRGRSRVVLIGTDCPGLTTELLGKAFDDLQRMELVLGPAEDGGYYLVGLRRPLPQIFDGVPWGTGQVLDRTLQIAGHLDLRTSLLQRLPDVDRPEDLHVWTERAACAPGPDSSPRLSIIIPTLNEAKKIADVLALVLRSPEAEVIVVDGGSSDGTADLATAYGATVLSTDPCRGKQMNAGARAANSQALLFLHADTRPPLGFEDHILRALSPTDVVAGAFELEIDAPGRALRLIERVANWRSRRMHMPYGDQAVFVKAAVFDEIGGYPEIPVMEDYELIRRLRRRGRIAILPVSAKASARRWLRLGPWKTTLINQLMILGYHLGVSPSLLARFYSSFDTRRRRSRRA